MQKNNVVVVGAGPAGMMAAIRAAQLGAKVTLLEKNPTLGKKLLLSGKGRCNLTNACDLDLFLKRFSNNGAFLRDAFKKFFNKELISFFSSRGLELKVERQLRVFPVTDKSLSILSILESELKKLKVSILVNTRIKNILVEGSLLKGLYINEGNFISCDKLILATGGVSYSFTGSSGDGLKLAALLGHNIVSLRPGLVPLVVEERFVKDLEGLTLKNIRLRFYTDKKELISEIGELVFTSFGISGPLVLTLSSKITDWIGGSKVFADIDLKPALTLEQLHLRLMREFKLFPKKGIRNILKSILPLRLIDLFIKLSKIDRAKKSNQVTQKEREGLVSLIKSWRLCVISSKPIEYGMVTRGGVSLKQIDPRTMESRLVKGLYFCGEMIDIDADTGGFNLQAAFSTGYLAGESAAKT